MKCGVRNLVSAAYKTLLGTSCYRAVRTWFSKHQVYIVNVSVVRAEIACNELFIDYREAVLHGKIWPFNEKRGKPRVTIGCRGMTFTLKRIGEFSQERAEIACNKLLMDYRDAVLHGKIWPFSEERGKRRMIIGCRGMTFTLKRIGEFSQEIISSMYQWLEQKLLVISSWSITERLFCMVKYDFSIKKEEYLRWREDLAKFRLIVLLMRSIGVFLAF